MGALGPREWVALPLLILASAALAAALRFVSIGSLAVLARRLGRLSGFPIGYPLDRLYRVANLASWLTHGKGRCLPRSLLLLGLVRAQVELLVGIAREGSLLQGHAWVLHGGLIVGEGREAPQRFAELVRFCPP
jgi:hypothetical protein